MLRAVTLVAPLDPTLHLRVFVGGVVIDNEVQGQAVRRLLFKVFDEGEPFLVGVTLRREADFFPLNC